MFKYCLASSGARGFGFFSEGDTIPKKFPIHHLKIDQSFVKDISVNPTNAAIVNTIIALARNLKLVVIAEGVENDDDLKILQEFNCDTVQGYLFSRPVEASEVPEIFDRFECNRIVNT